LSQTWFTGKTSENIRLLSFYEVWIHGLYMLAECICVLKFIPALADFFGSRI